MKKRVLSMLLVLIMVLAMLPAAMVMAEEAAAAEETVITLDFNADAEKGKNPASFTLEEDGWEYDADASHDVTTVFYRYTDAADETKSWDYSCLRFTQTDYHGTGVVNFTAPEEGTYTMELTYCYGGPGHYTDVTVGGTTTQYFGWSPWGTAPATVTTQNVSLQEGENSISFAIREDIESKSSYMMIKKIVFTKQPDPTSGLIIDLAAAASNEAALSTLAVTGDNIVADLGWGIDTDKTAPYKNPTQTFLYYVVKGGGSNAPALEDGSAPGVYIPYGTNGGVTFNFYVPKTGYYRPDVTSVSNYRCGVTEITVDGASVGTYDGYGTDTPVLTEHAMEEVYLTRGIHEVFVQCVEPSPRDSNLAWSYVNAIEFVEICKHTETTTEAISGGNGKHTATVTCDSCGEVVSTESVSCVDADDNAICDVCDTLISVTYDFNAAYGQGKTLAGFTVEEDGWEYDYEASCGGTPIFFRYNSGTDTSKHWDYYALRFTQSEVDDAMVLNFMVPADGTYTLTLTHAYGGPGNYTNVNVGGASGKYFGWSAWGTAPGTFVLEDVELKAGVNSITLDIAAESTGSYIMVKDMTFTKQAAPASGLVIDLYDVANSDVELQDLSVPTGEVVEELGWGINTEKTNPANNLTQIYKYYVCKSAVTFPDETKVGVYLWTYVGDIGVTLNFYVPNDGYYAPVIGAINNNNTGECEVYVDGESVGTYNAHGSGPRIVTDYTMDSVYLTKGIHEVTFKGLANSPSNNYCWQILNKITFEAVAEEECDHSNTTEAIVSNENGTHTVTVTCVCGEVISTETVACTGEGKCECGYEFPCDHSNTSEATTSNGDKTHTVTVTCECGEVIEAVTVDCTDEDKDCLCDACGATIKEITKITVVGANMTLGNDLKMNFMIKKSDMQEGFVAMVSQAGAEPVALELWDYNALYYAASYSVAAKEMTDVLSVEIYDADGYLVSNEFTRTIKQYAMTLLNNASQKASLKSVIVDMLNYGTEAQKYFGHNEDAYANAEVTEEQQTTYATATVECVNNQQSITNFVGSNLSLEDSILLNVFFKVTYSDALTATVSFTDYQGKEVTAEGELSKYSSMTKCVINQIVLADAKRPVTVTVYDGENVVGQGVESVESYIARNLTNESTGAINMAIMKFSASAYAHLGGTN